MKISSVSIFGLIGSVGVYIACRIYSCDIAFYCGYSLNPGWFKLFENWNQIAVLLLVLAIFLLISVTRIWWVSCFIILSFFGTFLVKRCSGDEFAMAYAIGIVKKVEDSGLKLDELEGWADSEMNLHQNSANGEIVEDLKIRPSELNFFGKSGIEPIAVLVRNPAFNHVEIHLQLPSYLRRRLVRMIFLPDTNIIFEQVFPETNSVNLGDNVYLVVS